MNEFGKGIHKVLAKEDVNTLLAKQPVYSWLTDACLKELKTAVRTKRTTVVLPRPGWTKFKLIYRDDQVCVKPDGPKAPFGPMAWINLERLRDA